MSNQNLTRACGVNLGHVQLVGDPGQSSLAGQTGRQAWRSGFQESLPLLVPGENPKVNFRPHPRDFSYAHLGYSRHDLTHQLKSQTLSACDSEWIVTLLAW